MRAWESDHEEEPPASPDEGDDDDEVDEETKEKKMAMEIAKSLFKFLGPIDFCDHRIRSSPSQTH